MIEFLGLPGSGKSTYIINHPIKGSINPLDLIYNDNHIKQNINKLPLILFFIFIHPVLSLKVSWIMLRINYSTFFRRLKMFSYLFSTLGAIDKCQRKYGTDKLRIDEGINQVLAFIMYESSSSDKDIEKLWHLLIPFMADEVVYFNVNYEVIRQRLAQRKKLYGSEVQRDMLKKPSAIIEADNCIRHILKLIMEKGITVNYV